MWPTIHLGPLAVSSWGLFHVLGMTVAGYVAYARLLRVGIPVRDALGATLTGLLAGSAGAGIVFWLVQAAFRHAAGGETPGLRDGNSVLGAMLFVPVASVLYFRLRRLPVGSSCDAGLAAGPLGQAIGRIGCLLGGCCWGRPTDGWLAVNLPGAQGHWCPRYPTQLMSSLADAAIFVAALLIEPRLKARGAFPGMLSLILLATYFTKRFAMEFLREEHPLVLGGLSWAHVASLVGLVVVAAVWLVAARRHRRAGRRSAQA